MADNVEVKIVGDGGQARTDADATARSIDASLKTMAASLKNFGTQNKDTVSEAIRNNADLSRSFVELRGSVTSGFDAIAGVIARFRGVIATIGAALAGGAIGREAVASMIELRDTVHGLQLVFGTTAEAATQMAVQLKLAGVDVNAFEQMAFRIGNRLRQDSAEFDRLGVSVRDASGQFLPMDTILQNVYKRMQDFKVGTDQNLFALDMVGRNAKSFAADMEVLNATSQRAREIQRDLGIEMGPERQAQILAYKVEMNAFKVVLDELALRIGEALLPRLTALAEWFVSVGPTAIEATKTAMDVFVTTMQVVGQGAAAMGKTVAEAARMVSEAINGQIGSGSSTDAALTAFKNAMAGIGIAVTVIVTGIISAFTMLAGVASAVFLTLEYLWTTESFSVYAEKLKGKISEIARSLDDLGNRALAAMNKLAMATAAGDASTRKLYGNEGRGGVPLSTPPGGTLGFTPKPVGGGAEKSQMAGWEAALNAERDAYERMKLDQGSFERWSEEQTSAYWQRILGAAKMSDTEREGVLNKYYAAERAIRQSAFAGEIADLNAQLAIYKYDSAARLAILQDEYARIAKAYGARSAQAAEALKRINEEEQRAADQSVRIADIAQRSQEATSKFEYEMYKLNLDQEVALLKVSKQQSLAEERAYLASLAAVDVSALQARIAAMAADPFHNPVALAELNAKLLTVEQDYQKKLTALDQAAELEREKYALQAQQATESALGTLLTDLMGRTKSISQAFKDMANSIVKSLNEIASKKITDALIGPGTEGGGFLSKIFGGMFGGGAGAGQTVLATATTANTTATTLNTTALTALQAALTASSAANAAGGAGGIFGEASKWASSLFGGGKAGGDYAGFTFGEFPAYALGTPYVPRDTLAMVHRGEAIIPARQNAHGFAGGVNITNSFAITGPSDVRTQQQIAAAAAAGTQHAIQRNL